MSFFSLGKMTFGSLFKKPETVLYPVQKKIPPAQLKGHVANDPENCILCSICAKRCPCNAISVDKAARTWTIDPYCCIQCGSCIRECPKACLSMQPEYAPAAQQKTTTTVVVPE